MNDHVLFNLSNDMRKKDEMRGLRSFEQVFAKSLINHEC